MEWIIGSLGLFINVSYQGYIYAKTGFLLEHIRRDPIGNVIVFSTIPLFALIGYLVRIDRRHRRELEEFKNLTTRFHGLLQRDFGTSLKLIKDSVKWLEEESNEERGKVLDLMKRELDGLEEAMKGASKLAESHGELIEKHDSKR